MCALPFRGWPPEAVEFFEQLETDNSKAFWTANRETYDAAVRGPMDALGVEVEGEFGPLHVFRPYRDVRFSKDKTPYKTAIGAVTEGEGGEVFYVQLSAEGIMAASGYHQMARDQLDRYYRAVDDDRSGPDLVERIEAAEKARLDIGGAALKTAPRGYPRDHPRIRLLRHKGVTAGRSWPPAKWMSTHAALDRVTGVWREVAPINEWLAAHVGPSTEPPPEAR